MATGAGTATVVRGTAFSVAGLATTTVNCADPTVPATNTWPAGNALGPDTAPSGERSLTFAVEDTGTAVGPTAHVDDPSTITDLSVMVHPGDGALVGFAVVTLHPQDDPGYWQGLASLGTDTARDWHEIEASTRAFTWRHYDASGSVIGSAGAQTISGFLPTVGGDGDGAEVGLLYGCNGEASYLDDFRVVTASSDRSWDFEGATASLRAKPRRDDLTLGRRLRWDTSMQTSFSAESLPVMVQAKYAGSKRVRVVDSRTVALPTDEVQTTPIHNGKYRFVLRDSDGVEGAKSQWHDITVHMIIDGKSATRSARLGGSFRVTGSIRPTDRGTKVLVQRRTSSGWQTAASRWTPAGERISISVPANHAGKQTFRLLARANTLNAGDVSKPFTLTVTAPSSGGGGTGGTGGGTGGGGTGGGGGDNPPGGPQRPTA